MPFVLFYGLSFFVDAIDAIMTQFNVAYKMLLLPFVHLVLSVVYQVIPGRYSLGYR